MAAKTDLTGRIFCRLTVIKESRIKVHGKLAWECVCECGNSTTVKTAHLNNGNVKSCGCLKSDLSRMRATEFPIRLRR